MINKQESERKKVVIKLDLTIECGQDTCASEPGEFCQFTTTRPGSFGRKAYCRLFFTDLYDKDGWLQRCSACKKLNVTRYE